MNPDFKIIWQFGKWHIYFLDMQYNELLSKHFKGVVVQVPDELIDALSLSLGMEKQFRDAEQGEKNARDGNKSIGD